MATVTENYFNLLTDEDGDNVGSELTVDNSAKKTPIPSLADAKKKNKKPLAAKKKPQTIPHAVMRQLAARLVRCQVQEKMKETVIERRQVDKLDFEVVMQNNQQKEKIVETKLTPREYEKKNNEPQAAKKKPQSIPHAVMRQLAIRLVRRQVQERLNFEVIMQNNQQKEKDVETKLTLDEYEKELLEKKQGLNAVWGPEEERKVSLDKDFEPMKFVHKKKALEER